MDPNTVSIPTATSTGSGESTSFHKSLIESLNDLYVGDFSQFREWINPSMLKSFSSNTSLLTVSAGIATIAVTAIGVSSLWKMSTWKRRLVEKDSGKSAPGPKPIPFLGNTIALKSNYYKTLYEYVDKPVSIFWVLSTPFVVVNDKEALRRVLGGAGGLYMKPKYFGYKSKAVKQAVQKQNKSMMEDSIAYNPNGDASRKALESLVRDSFDKIKTTSQVLMSQLADASADQHKSKTQSNTTRRIRTAIVGLNLDVLFEVNETSEKTEDSQRVAEMIEFAGAEFAQRMLNPLKVLVDIPGNLRYLRDVGGLIGLGRRLCDALDKKMSEYLAGNPNTEKNEMGLSDAPNWVHAWIGKVGKIGKLGKVVGLLMASTQTVPLSAVWMLHLVGTNKNVLSELRKELKEIGVNKISDMKYDDIKKMVYGEAVIKETLRMYPPFPLIQREAQKDDILGGVCIPAGTPVYVVPWLVHRNEKYWSNAHCFKPERFLQEDELNKAYPGDWVYLPFGRGSRMCAGSRLAITELKVLLAHAVTSYEWESIDTSVENGRDERFPYLGMIPVGIEFSVKHRNEMKTV